MFNTLTFCVCNNIEKELRKLVEIEKLTDVKICSIPSKCSDNSFNDNIIPDVLTSNNKTNDETILLGCNTLCSTAKTNYKDSNFEVYQFGNCLDILLGKSFLNYLVSRGYYLITINWLDNFQKIFAKWGFNKNDAVSFFKESAKKFLIIDTGLTEINYKNAEELSNYINMPVEIMPVGRDVLREFILNIVLDWRLKNEKKFTNTSYAKLTRQSADYSMVFDFIVALVEIENEEEIINKIFELMQILCAPKDIYFIPVTDSIKGLVIHKGDTQLAFNTTDEFLNIFEFNETDSFYFDILHLSVKTGIIIINKVTFPEYLVHYKNLIQTLNHVFGLAIVNARKIKLLKSTEEKARRYSEELAESNATKDKFFSIIAHDLKGAFHSLLGLTELFPEFTESEIREQSVELYKYLKINYHLLENLLTWARLQTERIECNIQSIQLSKIVSQVIELLKPLTGQKNILLLNLISEDVFVAADENMLTTILHNLISNATKFSFFNSEIIIGCSEKENSIETYVKDSGVGIKKENIDKLFRIDFKITTVGTNEEHGTGLGLSLCHELIIKNGGDIRVESEKNKGSTFFFTLKKADYIAQSKPSTAP